MKLREDIIKEYIEAYNVFDTEKMVEDFDEDIVFENISNGELNLAVNGIEDFKSQANQAKNYFESRTQTIKSFKHTADTTEVEIDYYAILAANFPNGLKEGDELRLQGKSIFEFNEKNKIVKIVDIS
ncbi:nuclear transport factor 2 family protein [Pseudoxanthomonas sp. SGD-10]|nr:nuclear transport factor 2 family protein [Pseudoxanthomonas sp. SGD-10]